MESVISDVSTRFLVPSIYLPTSRFPGPYDNGFHLEQWELTLGCRNPHGGSRRGDRNRPRSFQLKEREKATLYAEPCNEAYCTWTFPGKHQ